jgi:hypothetical protein
MPYIIVAIIIIALIVSAYLKKPTTRGKIGEAKVSLRIGQTEENVRYVINNLIIPNGDKTSQIDHIVINPRGIFVIETKNYSGRIYGNENQHEWTQVLAYGKTKHKLYNPLMQNATHIYNVKKIVGQLPIHSLVVFTQNNTRYINASNVIPISALKSALASGNDVLSPYQMKCAYDALLSNRSSATDQEHVNNVKLQQKNLSAGICPRCNGKLVLKNGKYGNFWGCSNYPKCKFIKK